MRKALWDRMGMNGVYLTSVSCRKVTIERRFHYQDISDSLPSALTMPPKLVVDSHLISPCQECAYVIREIRIDSLVPTIFL